MAIKDLVPRQGNVDIVVNVIEKGEVREFQKFGKVGKVCSAKVKDATGEISLTLWNEDIEKINAGDTVHIINGYVGEWQDEKQLSTGKFGKMEIVSSEDAPKAEAETSDEETEEEALEELKSDEGEHILTEDEKTEEEVLDDMKTDEGEHILTDDEKVESEVLDDVSEEKVPNGEEKKE